jgi:hypothetical protein
LKEAEKAHSHAHARSIHARKLLRDSGAEKDLVVQEHPLREACNDIQGRGARIGQPFRALYLSRVCRTSSGFWSADLRHQA